MSSTGKLAVVALVALIATASFGLQASAASASDRAAASRAAEEHEREQASERWAAAVASAGVQARRVADAAAAVIGGSGDLARPDVASALDAALRALDEALEGRDIGAIAGRRDEVAEALGVFRQAVADAAEARKGEYPSADQAARDELDRAVAAVRAAEDLGVAEIGILRRAADRVVGSHREAVAAAEAAAAAAAASAAAAAAATGESGESGGSPASGASTTPSGPPPGLRRYPTELTIDAYGDYWPGCPVVVGEWDWWYYDSTGYVVVDPGYPYDIEVMSYEGRLLGVKSLPCIIE
jgi:hypothetical protein